MKSNRYVGIIAAFAIAATVASLGFAQMADNATMGNMTGGNMTMGAGNMTMGEQMNESGSISGLGKKDIAILAEGGDYTSP